MNSRPPSAGALVVILGLVGLLVLPGFPDTSLQVYALAPAAPAAGRVGPPAPADAGQPAVQALEFAGPPLPPYSADQPSAVHGKKPGSRPSFRWECGAISGLPEIADHTSIACERPGSLGFFLMNLPWAQRGARLRNKVDSKRNAFALKPRRLAGEIHTVCPAGPPGCDYAVIQDAVDAAADGDTIKIAAGTYSGVHVRPFPLTSGGQTVITQVVYISRSITLRGGYTTSNSFADPPDPAANPTTLDALRQGRVIVVYGAITMSLEGLRLTGGKAEGPAGVSNPGMGSGVYAYGVTATISNCRVFDSQGDDYNSSGLGFVGSEATLISNTIRANQGSGVGIYYGRAALEGNRIANNYHYGVAALESTIILTANIIVSNVDKGVVVADGYATLNGNTISSNHGEGLLGGGWQERTVLTIPKPVFDTFM